MALQLGPQSAACLLSNSISVEEREEVKALVLRNLKIEWLTVLQFERDPQLAKTIHDECPYTTSQAYREIMCGLETSGWKMHGRLEELLRGWFPCINNSSNVEDVFAQLQDTVARSSKRDCGSLSNLQAVTIRALSGKTNGEDQASGISLEPADYEGASIRGLKPTCFTPTSCPSSA